MLQALREFTRFFWWMQTQCQVAANNSDIDLGCESAIRLLPSTSTNAISLLLSPKAGTHFTVPRRVEGWVELGTAGKVKQPMSKTMYHNGQRDVNHCRQHDSNLGSHKLQPGVTAMPLWPALSSQITECRFSDLTHFILHRSHNLYWSLYLLQEESAECLCLGVCLITDI